MVDGLQEGLAVAPGRSLGQWHIGVVEQTAYRRRRRLADDREVHHCGQRVEVGPRALLHAGDLGVLLHRRIAGLEDHRQGLCHVADHPARGAEIEQQRAVAAGQHHHVVGRDVAVVALLAVDHRQRLGQRVQQAAQPGLGGRAAQFLELVLQGLALVERHHHVGGAIGLPEAVDLDQRGVVELGQQPGLVDEALAAGLEGLAVALGLDLHLVGAGARCQHRGHVFLQRHPALQRVVVGQVDDAEAAFAEQRGQLELAQHGAHRQAVAHVDGGRQHRALAGHQGAVIGGRRQAVGRRRGGRDQAGQAQFGAARPGGAQRADHGAVVVVGHGGARVWSLRLWRQAGWQRWPASPWKCTGWAFADRWRRTSRPGHGPAAATAPGLRCRSAG